MLDLYKMIISPDSISFFIKILSFWIVRRVKRQKTVQKDKKLCPLHSISQEPYVILGVPNVIEILQNFEKMLCNHILVNVPNFKSIDAKLKRLYWDQLRKVDNYTHEKWKFWRQKMISNFLSRSSFIWLQKIVIRWFHKN